MYTTLEIISSHFNLGSYTLFYISYLCTRSATVLKHLQCVFQSLIESVLLNFPSPDPWQNAAPCCIQYISHIPVLQQPPQSPTTTIFLLSLQTQLMIPENTISSIESNTIRVVKAITATGMVARTRMGIITFPPPDAQFAEPIDMDVWTALQRRLFIRRRRNSSRVSETYGN